MNKDILELRRREFEHATWKVANRQKYGGDWPVLYDAGELGFCLLEFSGSTGGHWMNRWFDCAKKMPSKYIKEIQ